MGHGCLVGCVTGHQRVVLTAGDNDRALGIRHAARKPPSWAEGTNPASGLACETKLARARWRQHHLGGASGPGVCHGTRSPRFPLAPAWPITAAPPTVLPVRLVMPNAPLDRKLL